MTLNEHLSRVRAARERSGIEFTPDYVEKLRNKGLQRTAEKREMLRVIERRCQEAGQEARPAYF